MTVLFPTRSAEVQVAGASTPPARSLIIELRDSVSRQLACLLSFPVVRSIPGEAILLVRQPQRLSCEDGWSRLQYFIEAP